MAELEIATDGATPLPGELICVVPDHPLRWAGLRAPPWLGSRPPRSKLALGSATLDQPLLGSRKPDGAGVWGIKLNADDGSRARGGGAGARAASTDTVVGLVCSGGGRGWAPLGGRGRGGDGRKGSRSGAGSEVACTTTGR
ncbi:MAG: hypothetical protein HY902_03240 [Deltaproteobacteria bacterium]|nr:hypothetical protein [Deltaproteobacteria bacterium]